MPALKESEMVRTHRLLTTGALIVCLVGTQWSGTLFASEEEPSSSPAPSSPALVDSTAEVQGNEQLAGAAKLPRSAEERPRFTLSNEMLTANGPLGAPSAKVWRSPLTFVPVESTFAQRHGRRGRGSWGHNGAAAAIVLGAVASIAGGAVLVYANRPEGSTNQRADGCGYGTKVVGGAVLSAGIVGLVVGAVTW